VQEVIRPKLEECALEQIEVLDTLKSDLMERTARLRTVKAVKLRRQLEGDDGDGDSFSDTDSISTTSSMRSGSTGSNSTGYGDTLIFYIILNGAFVCESIIILGSYYHFHRKTHRSSKNRRKFERKLQSMREGSAYEDLAITAHLWNCIDKIQQEMKPYTSELLEALWSLEMNSLALSLGNSMDNLVAESNSIVLEVWQNLLTDELLGSKYTFSSCIVSEVSRFISIAIMNLCVFFQKPSIASLLQNGPHHGTSCVCTSLRQKLLKIVELVKIFSQL
jgi:hypothetical protein